MPVQESDYSQMIRFSNKLKSLAKGTEASLYNQVMEASYPRGLNQQSVTGCVIEQADSSAPLSEQGKVKIYIKSNTPYTNEQGYIVGATPELIQEVKEQALENLPMGIRCQVEAVHGKQIEKISLKVTLSKDAEIKFVSVQTEVETVIKQLINNQINVGIQSIYNAVLGVPGVETCFFDDYELQESLSCLESSFLFCAQVSVRDGNAQLQITELVVEQLHADYEVRSLEADFQVYRGCLAKAEEELNRVKIDSQISTGLFSFYSPTQLPPMNEEEFENKLKEKVCSYIPKDLILLLIGYANRKKMYIDEASINQALWASVSEYQTQVSVSFSEEDFSKKLLSVIKSGEVKGKKYSSEAELIQVISESFGGEITDPQKRIIKSMIRHSNK